MMQYRERSDLDPLNERKHDSVCPDVKELWIQFERGDDLVTRLNDTLQSSSDCPRSGQKYLRNHLFELCVWMVAFSWVILGQLANWAI
ncbi:hypothetical protein NOVOSPHI9U_210012 [Novosphingobium sp. 9U]|nr:hypothetical protein NOVOSPHI9U_210012 [Novosphingobium sp. 9U]